MRIRPSCRLSQDEAMLRQGIGYPFLAALPLDEKHSIAEEWKLTIVSREMVRGNRVFEHANRFPIASTQSRFQFF